MPSTLVTTALPNVNDLNLLNSSYYHIFSIKVENSVTPDQMAPSEANWSGSTVISKKDKAVLRIRRVK